MRVADVLDDRRLDALGRLVEDQQLAGRSASARPMASCCCWPPERSPPRRCSISLQHREHRRRCASGIVRAARGAPASPIRRFSSTVRRREDLAALRHVADARRARARRAARASRSAPVEARSRPTRAGTRPIRRAAAAWSCRRRCGPAARCTCPPGTSKRHVPQDVAAAVVLVEAGRSTWVDARSAPQIDFDHARIALHLRPCVPSASTLPSCSTVTVRAMLRDEVHVVLHHHHECSPASERNSSAVRSVSSSVMPATGSSTSSSLRLLHEQHADLEPLLLPVREQPGRRGPRRPSRPIVSQDVAAMRSRCSSSRAARRACARTRLSALQRELEVLEHRVVLEHRRLLELAADARARDLRLRHAREVDASGRRTPCPASGRVLPVITSIIVVLPAPLGPMMQRSSPGVDGRA